MHRLKSCVSSVVYVVPISHRIIYNIMQNTEIQLIPFNAVEICGMEPPAVNLVSEPDIGFLTYSSERGGCNPAMAVEFSPRP